MKTIHTKKIVAIVTAISLAFLQAIPLGVAANAPVGQVDPVSVSTPETAVAKEAAEVSTEPLVVKQLATSTDFLNGGSPLTVSVTQSESKDVSNTVKSATEQTTLTAVQSTTEQTSLTTDQIQEQMDQLAAEAAQLYTQAASQEQQASDLAEQAAQAAKAASESHITAQEEAETAAALTQKGQALLSAAKKDMAAVTARENQANKELAALRKLKPSRAVSLKIETLKEELNLLAKQKTSIAKKMRNAQAILQEAQEHQQLVSLATTEMEKQQQMATELANEATSLQEQAQVLIAEAASKVADADVLNKYLSSLAAATQESDAAAAYADQYNNEIALGQDMQNHADHHQDRIDAFQAEIETAQNCINNGYEACTDPGYTDQWGSCSMELRDYLENSIAIWSGYIADEVDGKADALNDAADHFEAAQNYASQVYAHMRNADYYAYQAAFYYEQVQQIFAALAK